jgi:histidinol-phosphatase (PHP family)
MTLFDYHAHTPRCNHADGPMEAYVERALALGMDEFGFSEHSPWMVQDPGRRSCLTWEEVEPYTEDVRRLQERYDRTGGGGERPFKLRLGLEADYVPSRVGVARETFERYPWDYVIGSVHHVGFWCIPKSSHAHKFDRHRVEDVYELYFEVMRQMVRERFCDVIAHLDLPKKHGRRPDGGILRYVEPLIPEIKAAGMAVEINTSGLDCDAGDVYPGWDSIEALHAAGVPLLVNSDSHKPEHVGRHFGPTLERLRTMGVKTLVRFEERQPIETPLPEAGALARMES